MPRFIDYDYKQTVLLPVAFEDQILPAPSSTPFTTWSTTNSTCVYSIPSRRTMRMAAPRTIRRSC